MAAIVKLSQRLREGSKKNPERGGLLPTPPRTPPRPPVWSFLVNFPVKFVFFLHFLMENRSIMPETDFKQKQNF